MSGDVEELEALTETGHHVTGASGHEVHHGLGDSQYVFVFVGILLLGLAYAWRKGVLTWR